MRTSLYSPGPIFGGFITSRSTIAGAAIPIVTAPNGSVTFPLTYAIIASAADKQADCFANDISARQESAGNPVSILADVPNEIPSIVDGSA